LREVERAVSNGMLVVPVRIEDIAPTGDLEYFLSATHWLDALTPPLEQHIEKLNATLSQYLGKRNMPAPDPAASKPKEPKPSSDTSTGNAIDDWTKSSSKERRWLGNWMK